MGPGVLRAEPEKLGRRLSLVLAASAALFATACGRAAEAPPAAKSPCCASKATADRPLHLDTAGKRIVERRELDAGRPAPAFALTDQDERRVTLESLKGSVVVMGFIYTHCPDVCGLLTKSLLDLQDRFADRVAAGDLRLLLVTTDPARDDPARGRKYTAAYGGTWRFLTGSFEECEKVWKAYAVNRTYNPDADYVYHTYKVVVIDRKGDLRYEYVGLDDPSRDMEGDLAGLLGGRP